MNGLGSPETAPANPVWRNEFKDLGIDPIGSVSLKDPDILRKVGTDPGKLRILLQYL
jgi:hypothetical protein